MTHQLRGHLMLLMPIVEDLARVLSARDVPGQCALAGVAEARRRLGCAAGAGAGLVSSVAHARRLARSLDALCDHYEELAGGEQP